MKVCWAKLFLCYAPYFFHFCSSSLVKPTSWLPLGHANTHPSTHPRTCPSTHPNTHPNIHPSTHLSTCLKTRLGTHSPQASEFAVPAGSPIQTGGSLTQLPAPTGPCLPTHPPSVRVTYCVELICFLSVLPLIVTWTRSFVCLAQVLYSGCM